MISYKNIFSKTLLFSLCISVLNGLNAAERIHLDLSGKWQAGSSDNLKLQLPPPVKNWQSDTVPHKNGRTGLINTTGGPYMPNPARLLTKDGKSLKKQKDLTAWFRREFSVKSADLHNRVPMLHLGGAAYRSSIWINGKKAGETVQCCTPLDFPLKGLLKPGKNQITIAVTDREGLLSIPDKCYVSPCNGVMAGIRGPVQIDFLPETFIEDVYIRTSVKNKKIDF